MQLFHCELPLSRIKPPLQTACNQAQFHGWTNTQSANQNFPGNVRLMRRAKDRGNTRFVLAGKLADVCAALDAMAAQEQHFLRLATQ